MRGDDKDVIQNIKEPLPITSREPRILGVRWDRRVGRWGALKQQKICEYLFHFKWGFMTEVTTFVMRPHEKSRGCSPTGMVGWVYGTLFPESAVHSFALQIGLTKEIRFSGSDFFCGSQLVTQCQRLTFLNDGTCLAELNEK